MLHRILKGAAGADLRVVAGSACRVHFHRVRVQVLNAAEKAWVDAYHKEVWEKVSNAAGVLLAMLPSAEHNILSPHCLHASHMYSMHTCTERWMS
jgi:C-terminal region of peptidase_M24